MDDFVDLLTPETVGQRAARIAVLIAKRQAEHRGHVDVEWLARESKYRRSAVVEAMWALQDQERYRLYRNDKKVLCIEPAANSTHDALYRTTRSGFQHYIREGVLAAATAGLTFGMGLSLRHPKVGLLAGGLLCWLCAFIRRLISEQDSGKD